MEIDKFVKETLEQLGLEKFSENFIEHEIDKPTFLSLTKEELAAILPGKLGPQKKIIQHIEHFKKNPPPPIITKTAAASNEVFEQTEIQEVVIRQKAFTTARTGVANKSNENRKLSVIQTPSNSTPKTDGNVVKEAPKSSALDSAITTAKTVGAIGVPIALTIVGGMVKREVIKNYTAPALNALIDDKPDDGLCTDISETIQEAITALPFPSGSDEVDAATAGVAAMATGGRTMGRSAPPQAIDEELTSPKNMEGHETFWGDDYQPQDGNNDSGISDTVHEDSEDAYPDFGCGYDNYEGAIGQEEGFEGEYTEGVIESVVNSFLELIS